MSLWIFIEIDISIVSMEATLLSFCLFVLLVVQTWCANHSLWEMKFVCVDRVSKDRHILLMQLCCMVKNKSMAAVQNACGIQFGGGD
jgi:hypothetical protein